MKKTAIMIFMVLSGAGLSYAAVFFINNSSQSFAAMAPPAIRVVYSTLSLQKINPEIRLSGRLVSYQSIQVRPQVTGLIKDILFTEGVIVKKDQPLYQLDARLYQTAYDKSYANQLKAQATLSLITVQAKRYQKLWQTQMISQDRFDTIQAELAQAKAELQLAQATLKEDKINLDYTTIRAPISGYIGEALINNGDLVIANQDQALCTIQLISVNYISPSTTIIIPQS